MIVEVVTDEGIIGWGEALYHGQQPPHIATAFIEQVYKPILLGRNPFDVEVLWEEMYTTTRPFGQGGAAVNAISGIDIALWDVIGKSVNKPIHSLIGGAFRTTVTLYATGFYRVADGNYPEDAVTEAQSYVDAGFQAFKLKIGFGIEEDISLIRSIRNTIGDKIRIMADANGGYNVAAARRIIKETEDCNIYFYEEMLPPEDLNGYQQIKNISKSYSDSTYA